MADISAILSQMVQTIYGQQMRQLFADGLNAVNTQAQAAEDAYNAAPGLITQLNQLITNINAAITSANNAATAATNAALSATTTTSFVGIFAGATLYRKGGTVTIIADATATSNVTFANALATIPDGYKPAVTIPATYALYADTNQSTMGLYRVTVSTAGLVKAQAGPAHAPYVSAPVSYIPAGHYMLVLSWPTNDGLAITGPPPTPGGGA